MQHWKKLASKYIYEALPFFRLRQDECELADGTILDDYYVMEQPDVVLVFAVTDDDEVLLVEQYKHGIQKTMLELPGGLCDSDDFINDARRELLEETGYAADHIRLLKSLVHDPTRCTNRIHGYLATNAKKVAEQSLDATENINIRTLPLSEIQDAVRDGRIIAAGSTALVYMALDALRDEI